MYFSEKKYLYAIWIIALGATLGSLFFSEVMGFTPCLLCWYQRIFWYPLVLLLPIAIIHSDKMIRHYILALVIPGGLIALYHTLLNWNVIPETLAPCTAGVSCITKYINWLGFINIPFLSLLGFLTILVILWKLKRLNVTTLQPKTNNK